jgi:hypothetical protein
MDKEFKILVLGALNWIMGELWRGDLNGDPELQDYYMNDWLPRQRRLIDELLKDDQ